MAEAKTATDYLEEIEAALEANVAFAGVWTVVNHANGIEEKPMNPTVYLEWIGEGVGALSDTDPSIPSVNIFAALVYPTSGKLYGAARKAVAAGVREIMEIMRDAAGTETPSAYRTTYHPLDTVGGIKCVSADMEIEYRISI